MKCVFLRLMSSFLVVVLLAVPAAGAAQGTAAADKEARVNFNLGRAAYGEGRYRAALGYFKQAYDLSGRPKLLYNVAQTQERLQHDEAALEAYRRYLAELPDAANRSVVERRIEILRAAVAGRRQLAAAAAAPVVPSPAEVANVSHATTGPRKMSAGEEKPREDFNVLEQWWFWTAAGVVVVGATVGIVAAATADPDVEPMLPGDDGVVVRALRF